MCEFKVFLNREKVFEEAIYAKAMRNGVILKDILGSRRVFKNCHIQEIEVASETMTLSSIRSDSETDLTPRREGIGDALAKAAGFHGHLGPFLIVGVRMGRLALERFEIEPFYDDTESLSVVAETGTKPPISCIIDGIQWSTGCTVGNGKIGIEDLGRPSARFRSGGRELRIGLRDQVLRRIQSSLELHPSEFQDLNKEITTLTDNELLQVNQGPRGRL